MKKKNIIYCLFAIGIVIILVLGLTDLNSMKKLYIVVFHKNGTIGHLNANGKLNGRIDSYVNGVISRKANFKNDLFDGWTVNYYPNGLIMTKRFYKNNKMDSEFNYYSNGKIKSKESFKDGKYEGPKITYYQNGRVEQKSMRKNDKVNGTEYEYYETGNLKYTRGWINDKPYGELKYYDENKKLSVYHTYDILGDKFYLSQYDPSGKVLTSEGYVFSSNTYSMDIDNDSIEALKDGNTYKSINDFYVTVANPPQSTPKIRIIINNKICKNLIFPDHNTVMVKNVFNKKGLYNIVIDGIFVGKSGVTDHTAGKLRITRE